MVGCNLKLARVTRTKTLASIIIVRMKTTNMFNEWDFKVIFSIISFEKKMIQNDEKYAVKFHGSYQNSSHQIRKM